MGCNFSQALLCAGRTCWASATTTGMGFFGCRSGKEGACGLSIPFLIPPGQEQGAKPKGKAELLSRWAQQGSAVLRRSDLGWLWAAASATESPKRRTQLCIMSRPEKKVLETTSLHWVFWFNIVLCLGVLWYLSGATALRDLCGRYLSKSPRERKFLH